MNSASGKCLQVVLAIFNLAFLIFGIMTIAALSVYISSNQSAANAAGVTLITVASISIFVGIFGCVGAFTKSRCALIIYATALLFLGVLGGVAVGNSGKQETIHSYGTSIWDSFSSDVKVKYENDNKCCGYDTILDRTDIKKCPVTIYPCGPILEKQLSQTVSSSGIYLFVAAGCEAVAIIIAFVLIFDSQRKYYH